MSLARSDLYRVGYEVDFTAQANLALVNGANVIDGHSWTMDNRANVASADVVNGTGIVIVANATNTGYYEGAAVRTAATLSIPVISCFAGGAGYDIGETVIRVLLRVLLTNADANAEGAKLAIENITTPANQHAWLVKWFSAGALKYRMSSGCDPAYEVVSADSAINSSHDILGLVFTPDRIFEGFSGAYAAGEMMRLTQSRGAIGQNIAVPSMRFSFDTSAGPRIMMCQVTNNVAGSLTTTFTHMRVDFAPRHADL